MAKLNLFIQLWSELFADGVMNMAIARMTNLVGVITIVVTIAVIIYGTIIFTEQVLNAQFMAGKTNGTNDNSTNKSGTISSLPLPIRPPFASFG